MKILILIDKLSQFPTKDEEDTLIEANEVKSSLIKIGHNPIISYFSLNLEDNITDILKEKPDLIFNLVETLSGASTLHIAPLLFEKYKIKYTGGNSTSLLLTGNKIIGKLFLKSLNIKTPKFYYSTSNRVDPTLINNKVIVKEVDGEASLSIEDSSVKTFKSAKELKSFIKASPNVFVEQYIDGKEFNVSVMKIKSKIIILPIAQMLFKDFPKDKPQILNYKSKWDENSFEYNNTERTFDLEKKDTPLYKKMKTISKKCYKALGNKGYLRVDFRVDEKGEPYVLEININPCITQDSGFIAAANQYGLTYDKTIKNIVNEAINGWLSL